MIAITIRSSIKVNKAPPEEFLPELLPRSDGKAVAIALVLP